MSCMQKALRIAIQASPKNPSANTAVSALH